MIKRLMLCGILTRNIFVWVSLYLLSIPVEVAFAWVADTHGAQFAVQLMIIYGMAKGIFLVVVGFGPELSEWWVKAKLEAEGVKAERVEFGEPTPRRIRSRPTPTHRPRRDDRSILDAINRSREVPS
jgi:hypothetical protein